MTEIQGNVTPEETIGGTVYASDVPSGGGSGASNAEVIDARKGHDGTVFQTLGEAIRTQVRNLWNAVNGKQPAGDYLTEVPDTYATKDYVTNKIAEAELSGDNDIDLSGFAEKSEIPTKVSQLENDAGYLTEHQDISGKLDASELPTAINTALAQAKASGEFDGQDGQDGQDGKTPVKGVDYFDGEDGQDGYSPTATVTQTADGASINITDKNGTTTATIVNGKDGSSTRNLLINSDFRNPVNQRGKSSYTVDEGVNRFAIDRWFLKAYTQLDVGSTGITLVNRGYIALEQTIEGNVSMRGKKFTGAICLSDDTVILCTGTFPVDQSDVYQWFAEANTEDGVRLEMAKCPTTDNLLFSVCKDGGVDGETLTLKWAVVYEGEYTAETLPEYCPKGYERELLVCRQYDLNTGEYIGLRKFGSARNLLDNSDFTNPVNQRGQTSYTNSDASKMTYAVDRWKFIHGTFTVNDGYINYASTKGATYKRIVHMVNKTLKAGKPYTIAMRARVNEIGNLIRFRPCTSSYGTISGASQLDIKSKTNNFETFLVSFTLPNDAVNPGFDLLCFNTANDFVNIDIEWTALYEGVYTIDTLPEYQSKGYATELMECQRYFFRTAYSTNNMFNGDTGSESKNPRFHIPTPIQMIKANPTVTITAGSSYVVTPNASANIGKPTVASAVTNGNFVYVCFSTVSSAIGSTPFAFCGVQTACDISADL